MKVIKASYEIMDPKPENLRDYIYKKIERAGRTCYKSEDKITDSSAAKFILNLVSNGHEAMLEHASMTVKFISDRGFSHEMVRHRMASFAQESTRYCNYSTDKFGGEITFIKPLWFDESFDEAIEWVDRIRKGEESEPYYKRCSEDPIFNKKARQYIEWLDSCGAAEYTYKYLIEQFGWTPEMARCVLTNSLKTEVVVTANMREWRHILSLRAVGTTGKPHPQIKEVMAPLLKELGQLMPELFSDLSYEMHVNEVVGK